MRADDAVHGGAGQRFMELALEQALRALNAGEAPIGACIVRDGELLASAHNGLIAGPDATAHAEIVAIRAACRALRRPRLGGCELYVSVEPCAMCVAACAYAGIGRIVYAASLADFSAVSGQPELPAGSVPGVELSGGLLAARSRELLSRWHAPACAG
ncbi:MAG: nucleoside deaminase [Chromatiales bacterium]|nr:nucleoside deaminase [Chromatiales bacterium]